MNLNNCNLFKVICLFIAFFLISSSLLFAQQSYEPKILVLAPAKTSVSTNLAAEFKAQSDTIAKMVAQLKASMVKEGSEYKYLKALDNR